MIRGPVGEAEHEPAIGEPGAHQQPLLELRPSMVPKRRNSHAIQLDSASSGRRLGSADHLDMFDHDHRLRNRQHPSLEVDIRPTQTERFTAPKPRSGE